MDGETPQRAKNLEIFELCVIRKGRTADSWNSEVLLLTIADVDRSQRMESLSRNQVKISIYCRNDENQTFFLLKHFIHTGNCA